LCRFIQRFHYVRSTRGRISTLHALRYATLRQTLVNLVQK
jgi:hypothetical protein